MRSSKARATACAAVFLCVHHQRSGEGAPDCQLAIGGKHWADAAVEAGPSLWKMAAKAYGQAKAHTIRKSLDDSIAKTSVHFDQYHAELSYIAGK